MKTLANSLTIVTALFPAFAVAEVDTSDWKCEFCPFERGYRASVDAGATYVSDDEARFGNASGLDEEGGYADVSGNGRYRSDDLQLDWHARDVGLDSRRLELSLKRSNRYSAKLSYREQPYRLFGNTRTVFLSASDEALRLPADWTRASQTSGFSQLGTALRRQPVETDRQVLFLGGDYRVADNFEVFADYERQQRDGVSIGQGAGFTRAAFLPEPIDDHTDQLDLGARFRNGNLHLSVGYHGSFYRNGIGSLTWDNPFTSLPGADAGRLATAPDNDFQQLLLSGVYRADALDTVVSFSAAMGRGEQDATFLPYTINPNLAAGALPRTSLDGEVDTQNLSLTITSRPHDKLRLRARLRQDERDNGTAVSQWSRVITDAFVSGDAEPNVPYSYERSIINLSADYRALRSVNLSAGFDRREVDRDFQEVAEQTEESGWGRIRWRPSATFEATIKAGNARREVDRYDTDIAQDFGQNPLLRKYNLAYRYREFGEATITLAPEGSSFSAGLSFLVADDSYTESQLGITDARESRTSIDFGFALSERSSLYLHAGSESIESQQLSSESVTSPNWSASHDDNFLHYGGGFRMSGLADKVSLQLDYSHSDGSTDITVASVDPATANFPALESIMDSVRFSMNYAVSERLSTHLTVRYEHFDVDDWALDGVGVATVPTLLTMGASAYDYDIWAIGLGIRYRIGAD